MDKPKERSFLKINVVLQDICEDLVKTCNWICFVFDFHGLFKLGEIKAIVCSVYFYLHAEVSKLDEVFLWRCLQD